MVIKVNWIWTLGWLEILGRLFASHLRGCIISDWLVRRSRHLISLVLRPLMSLGSFVLLSLRGIGVTSIRLCLSVLLRLKNRVVILLKDPPGFSDSPYTLYMSWWCWLLIGYLPAQLPVCLKDFRFRLWNSDKLFLETKTCLPQLTYFIIRVGFCFCISHIHASPLCLP